MATVLVRPDPQKFAVGASMAVYSSGAGWQPERASGPPPGTLVETQTVAAGGIATYTTLTSGVEYVGYASGPDRYWRFEASITSDVLATQYGLVDSRSLLAPAATGVAATDQASLAATVAALVTGDSLTFRKGQNYVINDALSLAASNVSISLNGATITQTVVNKPVFDCRDYNDVTIDGTGGLLANSATRAWSATAFRGDSLYLYNACIWSSGNRGTFKNLRCQNVTAGVQLSNYDFNTLAFNGYRYGNRVENLTLLSGDFGICAWGQDSPTFRSIKGTYSKQGGSANPPHLVYVSGPDKNANVEDVIGYDSTDTDAYVLQMRTITGGTARGIQGRNCKGILNILGCADLTVSGVSGTGCPANAETGLVTFGDALSSRVEIADVSLNLSSAGRAVFIDGTDNRISGLHVHSNRSASTGNPEIKLAGTRCAVDGLKLYNQNTTTTGGDGIAVFGTACVVRNVEMRGVRNGILVDASATGAVLDFDSQLIIAESGFPEINNGGTGTLFMGRSTGSKTWDPPSVADGAMTSTTITIFSTAPGSTVAVGFSVAVPAGVILAGQVTATNVVTVTMFNKSGGAVDLASGTLWADVWRH